MNRTRMLCAARLYLHVFGEQIGLQPEPNDPIESSALGLARASIEDLIGWQVVVTCAGWAIGSLLTATGLGLVIILERPEWRLWGPVPGLLAAAVTMAVVVFPFLRLPAHADRWLAQAATPQPRPSARPALPPPLPPAMTAPTLRCRGRPAPPADQPALESRLIRRGPATERMRFAVHPGRPGHDGATEGIDPLWPYVT